MDDLYRLILGFGDCEFLEEREILVQGKEKAEELARMIEEYSINIGYAEVIKVQR